RPHDDTPGEHSTRLFIEHTVEVFVTLAVIGRVIDGGVMVGVLLAGKQVESVQDQCAARTRHDRPDVVARERRAERYGVQVDGAVAPLMRLRRGDVVGALALPL